MFFSVNSLFKCISKGIKSMAKTSNKKTAPAKDKEKSKSPAKTPTAKTTAQTKLKLSPNKMSPKVVTGPSSKKTIKPEPKKSLVLEKSKVLPKEKLNTKEKEKGTKTAMAKPLSAKVATPSKPTIKESQPQPQILSPAKNELKKELSKPEKNEKPAKATKVEKVGKARGRKKANEPMIFELADIGTINRAQLNEDQKKWLDYYEKYRKVDPLSYNIKEIYTAKSPIVHPIFGWGFVISSEYDRLDVYFKDGKKLLISNRKI